MASPSSPKDKFVVNVINPYLAQVKNHPQTVQLEDGVLHQEDLKEPAKEGSIEARLEEMEQEVFKYKKMVERGVEANFDLINELKTFYKKEMRGILSNITSAEERIDDLQGQIYDLHNQSCEYELKFMRMGLDAGSRILETEASHGTGEPLPWKRFVHAYINNNNNNNRNEA